MTRHIQLISEKGGQGVTTTVVLLARGFEEQGLRVLMVDSGDGDLRPSVGLPNDDKTHNQVSTTTFWQDYSISYTNPNYDEYDVVLWDSCMPTTFERELYVVVQNCYLSLSRFSRSLGSVLSKFGGTGDGATPISGVIVVLWPNRALTVRDVELVANIPIVLQIPIDNDIQRKMDAALFSRLPTCYTIDKKEKG